MSRKQIVRASTAERLETFAMLIAQTVAPVIFPMELANAPMATQALTVG